MFPWEFRNTTTITCNIPKTKINGPDECYIHAHFIENLLIGKSKNIISVNVYPLTGEVSIKLYSKSEAEIKRLLNNLKDHLGNNIKVII